MATQTIIERGYVANLMVAIDQLGNAVTGGEADSTVSARVGYYSYKKYTKRKWRNGFWKTLRTAIDWAFKPLDGPEHCRQAYEADSQERFVQGSDVAMFFLGLLVLIMAPILGVLIRVGSLLMR